MSKFWKYLQWGCALLAVVVMLILTLLSLTTPDQFQQRSSSTPDTGAEYRNLK